VTPEITRVLESILWFDRQIPIESPIKHPTEKEVIYAMTEMNESKDYAYCMLGT
jgi:hypothetical protein